jgi:hypothetical protein
MKLFTKPKIFGFEIKSMSDVFVAVFEIDNVYVGFDRNVIYVPKDKLLLMGAHDGALYYISKKKTERNSAWKRVPTLVAILKYDSLLPYFDIIKREIKKSNLSLLKKYYEGYFKKEFRVRSLKVK